MVLIAWKITCACYFEKDWCRVTPTTPEISSSCQNSAKSSPCFQTIFPFLGKTKNFRYGSEKSKHGNVQQKVLMDWKSVHGLQLALHLSEGSEIKGQIFDRLDTDDLKGEVGWTTVIELLKQHYEKDDNTTAFETWKEF